MEPPTHWITETDALVAEVRLIGAGPLALDSESDSLHRYPEKLCLIQLSHGQRHVLIDPLAGVDLTPLGPVLNDVAVPKILHGADYDLRILHRDFGLTMRGLFDTMIAARLVGEPAFGLAALLERFVGVRLDKKFQKADWSVRPLSPEMEAYALLDTRHLRALADILSARLRELGRESWAAEEFERLESVRFYDDLARKADAFRRVKHSSRLAPRELAVLRELHALRESEAVRKGRPPYRIVRDEILLELSSNPVASAERVRSIRGMPRPLMSGRMLAEVLAAIGRGLTLAEAELPARVESRRVKRPPAELEHKLRELSRRRDALAKQLGLEPSVLASRTALEEAQARLDAGAPLEGLDHLRRWQAALLFGNAVPADQPPG